MESLLSSKIQWMQKHHANPKVIAPKGGGKTDVVAEGGATGFGRGSSQNFLITC